ncbi:MAG: 3-deoxy-D-manno-octulosonic acid transferase [Fusobacteriaceae bacterium]
MLYNILRVFIVFPLCFLIKLFSKKKKEFIEKRINQDFNLLKKEKSIWIHCSSMGEVNLSEPLVKKLLEEKDEQILISVFTDTGYENAKRKYEKFSEVTVIYFPLDSYFKIKKILSKINLSLLIIIETEIWPNLIELCSKKSKVIFLNGRISDKSLKKYKKVRFFLKPLFNKVSGFYMQSELDEKRIVMLGAQEKKVEILGNLKFCISFEEYSDLEKEKLKKKLFVENRKVIVLGSTRELEEEKILKNTNCNVDERLIIIVPRHLKRVDEVIDVVEKYKLSYEKYSTLENYNISEKKQIIIVDKMGLLRKFYSIADVVFVGGTLVNIGGHSLLEPIYYGKIPIFGKYIQNVKDISKELVRRKIGIQLDCCCDFEIAVNEVLGSVSKDREIKELFEKNKNVINNVIFKIENLIKN